MMLARADMLNIGRTMHGGCAVYIIDVCVYCSLEYSSSFPLHLRPGLRVTAVLTALPRIYSASLRSRV